MITLRAVSGVILFLVVASTASWAHTPSEDKLYALEKKLVGAWIGGSPCAGNLVFQADGTYHYADYGPGGGEFEVGSWKVEWTQLPPTLVLTPLPTEATQADDRKETRYYVVNLNDEELDFRWAEHVNSRLEKHRRGTETDNTAIRIAILDHAVQRYLGNAEHGAGVKLPPNLRTLVETKILPSSQSLMDPWGKEFKYDLACKRTKSNKVPEIWTQTPDRVIIDNWSKR